MSDLPTRKPNRLPGYDYDAPNAYFITICTQNRRNLLWENVGAVNDRPQNIRLSGYGKIADNCVKSIPHHYPAISLDQYVIMPNHVHLLLQIQTDESGRSMTAPTISNVVRMMKGAASKQAGFSLWQKGFYDHIVRGDADYREIWEYIRNNPYRWAEDELFHK